MKRWIFAVFLFSACAASAQQADPPPPEAPNSLQNAPEVPEIEEESDGRIVGGQVAQAGTVPWQAEIFGSGPGAWTKDDVYPTRSSGPIDPNILLLREKDPWEWNHSCGGAVIPGLPGQKGIWVLTAAHCVTLLETRPLTWRRVRLGTQDLNTGGKTYAIERVAIHRDYGAALAHDIALIRLVGTLPRTARPIRLIDGELSPQAQVSATGWGVTIPLRPGETGRRRDGVLARGSPLLKEVALAVRPDAECLRFNAYRAAITSGGAICAGAPTVGDDACQGDSGGPLTKVQRGEVRLAGLVSIGLGCGQKAPGVYVKLSAYRGWIDQAMRMTPPRQVKRIAP